MLTLRSLIKAYKIFLLYLFVFVTQREQRRDELGEHGSERQLRLAVCEEQRNAPLLPGQRARLQEPIRGCWVFAYDTTGSYWF